MKRRVSRSQAPPHARARVLRAPAEGIAAHEDEIATVICREAGKAWKYSKLEVARSVETFTFAAEEAKRIHGETIPMDASAAGENRIGFYLRMPMGVIGAISPFNFPLNLSAHKLAPAVAAGNPIVLKPATKTPLSAIRLGQLLAEAGVPEGGVSVLPMDRFTGDRLVTDDRFPPVGGTSVYNRTHWRAEGR